MESCGVGPIRIIAAIDGSPESDAVARAIARRSWPKETAIEVVSVVQSLTPAVHALEASTFSQSPAFAMIHESDEHEWVRLQGAADRTVDYLRRAGLLADATVVDGNAREVLFAKSAGGADAIFVGARGLGRIDRLVLGSVSTHVVNHARCTVEVVRPQ
jgi:nucleotide-binding universal stress UspA family protein